VCERENDSALYIRTYIHIRIHIHMLNQIGHCQHHVGMRDPETTPFEGPGQRIIHTYKYTCTHTYAHAKTNRTLPTSCGHARP
jgi:hypothetical protein